MQEIQATIMDMRILAVERSEIVANGRGTVSARTRPNTGKVMGETHLIGVVHISRLCKRLCVTQACLCRQ